MNPFGPWVSDDVILTLHNGLLQSYLPKNNFSVLEQVTWTPSTEDAIPYHLSKTSKGTKRIQKTPSKERSLVSQDGVDNLPSPQMA